MGKIKIENLNFTYPAKGVPALKGINISINTGEFVTICGKSGCGKTTLLRLLKPLISPYGKMEGSIYFDGKSITELNQRQQAESIGFVMQNPDNQIVCDKVWHELAFGLEGMGLDSKEIRASVAEITAFFGLQELYYKDTALLSGGQKQILNLAAVMVMQPSVLVLDEPTSQLDPIAAHNFLDSIAKINREFGTTIILSEHRLEEALPLSDRVIVMEDGEVIADGDVASVGAVLKSTDNDMMLALPTPMRVCYSVDNRYNVPKTIREGKEWLGKMPVDKEVKFYDGGLAEGDSVIKVKDVYYRYQSNTPDVLKGLNFEVREGELYAIVGGNGVGKTTALSAIMNIVKPYCGKIEIAEGKRIAALPQNPQNLFVRDTVLLDLWEMFENGHKSDKENEKKIQEVVALCNLKALLGTHPYDLSGGEQQRVALAKVLLAEPNIILLDEPTKGLDAHFKQNLAHILKSLQQTGTAIVMVSHDTEFCARFADRVAMFFDGHIVSEDTPRRFFTDKSFYTTAAAKMARGIIPDAVLDEDIISAIGGKQYERCVHTHKDCDTDVKPRYKKTEYKQTNIKGCDKISKVTLFAISVILLLIPITIFAGIRYFDDRKYYLVSLLVLAEAMLPFGVIFEGRRPQARELVLISVLCAIGVAGRVAFAMLPQFKPVLAIVIIAGFCLGTERGFLIGAITAFVSNFYFSQGPWTPWQMFAFGLIGFLSGLLPKSAAITKSKTAICAFGFVVSIVIYGGIMNSATVIMSQEILKAEMFWTSILVGLPMDLVLGVATAIFLWLALEPMRQKLDRIKIKYGLIK